VATRTVTVKPSGGDYTSLATALTTEFAAYPNLTVNNGSGGPGILIFEVSGSWSSAGAAFIISDFITSDAYYLSINIDSANRAIKSSYDSNRYRIEVTSGTAIRNRADHVRITGIQVKVTASSGSVIGMRLSETTYIGSTSDIRISNSRVEGVITGATAYGITCDASSGGHGHIKIFNTVINGAWTQGLRVRYCDDVGVFNDTVYGAATGIYQGNSASGAMTVKDCAVFGNGDDFWPLANTTIDYCASDDNDGTNNVAESGGGAAWPNDFVDAANGNFTLLAASGLVGTGVDDPGSGLYSDDIDGEARTSTWDVGADEYISGVAEIFFEHMLDLVSRGAKPQTAAGMGGVLVGGN